MRLLSSKITYLILFITCICLIIIYQTSWGEKKFRIYKDGIKKKYYRTLSKYVDKIEDKYSMVLFLEDSTLKSPVTMKGSPLFPNQLLIAERTGLLKKIDTVSHTTEIALDISDKVSKEVDAGFYNFAINQKDSIFVIAYTSTTLKGESFQNFELIPLKNKKLVYNLRQKLYKIPVTIHFGGGLEFDSSGHLYISTSDHSYGDLENYAQDLKSLYGKILRVKIDKLSVSIPVDNPFYSDKSARKEVWAYGLRNPFRMTFWKDGEQLIVGDVGHEKTEEVDIVEAGGNYGWSIREGTAPFKKIIPKSKLIDPIYEYEHGTEGFSVIGGLVYRGEKFPELKGKYIFGDYILGKVWAMDLTEPKPKPRLLIKNASGITSFYQSETGDILWTNLAKNRIYKLTKMNESLSDR